MEMKSVKSSNIKAVGYDRAQNVLAITFFSGGTYEYADVTNEVYENFINSGSLGKFFFKHIKTSYSTKKVN